ncbi:TOPRS ligase, partial [Smithornis capensis]|nr:TOPRS ligase [Smithornis capensis]
MATEWSCPICQDTRKDVASALPCRHRFCLGCILRWVHRKPSCPLCRRTIDTVRFSDDEDNFLETAVTAPKELPDVISQEGTAPEGLDENSPDCPVASHPSFPQSTLSTPEQGTSGLEFVGGILPEFWADLFRGRQQLLDPVRPWLRQRLEGIYRTWWWLVEAAESTILHELCVNGPNAEVLIERLQPLLEQHTAPLVHGVINIIVGQCSEEAQRMLCSGAVWDENNGSMTRDRASSSSNSSSSRISRSSNSRNSSPSSSSNSSFISRNSSSNSSWEVTPTSGPKDSNEEEEVGTLKAALQGGSSHLPPVTVPREQDQPQEESGQAMAVAGPSAQGSSYSPSTLVLGRDRMPRGTHYPRKKRATGPQDTPQPSKRPSCLQH